MPALYAPQIVERDVAGVLGCMGFYTLQLQILNMSRIHLDKFATWSSKLQIDPFFFCSNISIPWDFEVILLALVNDVTMLPVASDNASPSALPEIPSMPQILLAAFL